MKIMKKLEAALAAELEKLKQEGWLSCYICLTILEPCKCEATKIY